MNTKNSFWSFFIASIAAAVLLINSFALVGGANAAGIKSNPALQEESSSETYGSPYWGFIRDN